MTWQKFASAMVSSCSLTALDDAAFVAAEVRQRRDISRALILGTLASRPFTPRERRVLVGAGFDSARQSEAIATESVRRYAGRARGPGNTALVMISALGSANGLIFTGSRIYATVGGDYGVLAGLGRWDMRRAVRLWRSSLRPYCSGSHRVGRDTVWPKRRGFLLSTLWPQAEWEGRRGFVTL